MYTHPRDAIFGELYKIALDDPNVIILSADTGAFKFKDFQENIPDQFYNVGVAEQNVMSVAAGLALEGKRPFVYGISNFVTLRCLEQISVDICAMNLPVTIIGTGTGYGYSSDGPTHHIINDVSIMRSLPNMRILSPSDCRRTATFVHKAYEGGCPTYLRVDKSLPADLYEDDTDAVVTFNVLGQLHPVAIMSTGCMVEIAMEIARELGLVGMDVGQLKPVMFTGFRQARGIIALEEHSVFGGLGSIVAESVSVPVLRLGIPDIFRPDVGSREYLRSLDGLNKDQLIERIQKWMARVCGILQ